jgi:DHA1 family chloramphenicol resistance protein-like MFS transporter
MPIAVYLLGLSLFAMGSSEFLVAGVLPSISADLRISLPTTGTLISAYSVGVLVGAPPLAVLTLRWPRRTTLVVSQAVFVVSVAVGLLAPGYWPLLVSRVVSGLAYAGFWAAAAVTAVSLVTPDRTARAMSVVVGGLSLAIVAGGPLGTVIGERAGWRAGFWAVAVLTALTAVAVLLVLPRAHDSREPPRDLGRELRAMARPRLWLVWATTGAYMVTFGYLGALLIETSGLAVAAVPAVLSLFGVGALVGLAIGGRTADRHPFRTLGAGAAATIGVSVALALLADRLAVTIVLVFVLGVAGFLLNPAVYRRVFTVAADAPTLAGATTVSAFHVGLTAAPLLGGWAIAAGLGLASVGWVGAAIASAALGTALVDAALDRRERPTGG